MFNVSVPENTQLQSTMVNRTTAEITFCSQFSVRVNRLITEGRFVPLPVFQPESTHSRQRRHFENDKSISVTQNGVITATKKERAPSEITTEEVFWDAARNMFYAEAILCPQRIMQNQRWMIQLHNWKRRGFHWKAIYNYFEEQRTSIGDLHGTGAIPRDRDVINTDHYHNMTGYSAALQLLRDCAPRTTSRSSTSSSSSTPSPRASRVVKRDELQRPPKTNRLSDNETRKCHESNLCINWQTGRCNEADGHEIARANNRGVAREPLQVFHRCAQCGGSHKCIDCGSRSP